jgi:hypothetical protein
VTHILDVAIVVISDSSDKLGRSTRGITIIDTKGNSHELTLFSDKPVRIIDTGKDPWETLANDISKIKGQYNNI